MISLQDALPIAMFLAGCGLMCLILLRRWSHYFGRQSRRRKQESYLDQQPRPSEAWSGMQKDAAAHIERQKVELYEMARDTSGQLNTKMLALQALINQSDEQIDKLEKLLGEFEQRHASAESS